MVNVYKTVIPNTLKEIKFARHAIQLALNVKQPIQITAQNVD